MSTDTINTLNENGIVALAHALLNEHSMSAVLEQLTRVLRDAHLADQVTFVLFQPAAERVAFYGIDELNRAVNYEDETLLASGPVYSLRATAQPQVQRWSGEALRLRFPQLAALALYPTFTDYCLLPLNTQHGLLGGCEVMRLNSRPFSEQDVDKLKEVMTLVALAVEQVQWHQGVQSQQALLRHERDDYRILVDVTNAVLSKLDLNDLIAEITRAIHRFFKINAISIALCNSNTPESVNVYATHYLPDQVAQRQQYTLVLANTLEQQVMQSAEMQLLNLKSSDQLAEYERQLFTLWKDQSQTLCLLPLIFGKKPLGVLKLAQCQPDNFSTANLRVLRQIAERIAIAVDNALAYQQINALKEKLVHENHYLNEQINGNSPDFCDIVGRSPVMSAVLKQVEMVAKSDCSVLILGETGTGKELIARAIHKLSDRREQRMVKMNCAAMPAGLMESDLFGHEKGSFTGATTQRMGRFELADQGTLFLDEVGEIPLELQPKLLRILQEREFERVGGNKVISVNVRLIAATNRDLKQMVSDKEFRSDLYYRLNVFPIVIPPLRERPEDIPQLVKYLTFKIAHRLKRTITSIPAKTLHALSQLPWPGNVRELENVIERAVLLTQGPVLNIQLPELRYFSQQSVVAHAADVSTTTPQDEGDEYQRILSVLRETNGVVGGPRGAAERLGLKRTTLLSRMKKLGIKPR